MNLRLLKALKVKAVRNSKVLDVHFLFCDFIYKELKRLQNVREQGEGNKELLDVFGGPMI